MMKWIISALVVIIIFDAFPVFSQDIHHNNGAASADNIEADVPPHAQMLIRAYPDLHLRFKDNYIIFEDGTSMIYDDGVQKEYLSMLDNSDIEDMFFMKYPKDENIDYLQDAGRSRCEAFFKKIYGENAIAVKKNLVNVAWFGTTVKFTKINGAAEQLGKVANEIRRDYPELVPYMKSSGTFYWRQVRGAKRLSSHSYGIAIDIAVKQSDYWKWGNPKAKETDRIDYKNRIPMEIVRVFEKYGFIWGGRWYHYDTMHFEYRPEILNNREH